MKRASTSSIYSYISESSASEMFDRRLPDQHVDQYRDVPDSLQQRVRCLSERVGSGLWRSSCYVRLDAKHIFISDVWGWESEGWAVAKSSRAAINFASRAASGKLPFVIYDPLGNY
jgi:hypothetical protein